MSAKKSDDKSDKSSGESSSDIQATGLEGTVTVKEKAGYVAKVLAYQSLKSAAREIAKNIDEKARKTDEIILINGIDLAAKADAYVSFKAKLNSALTKSKAVKDEVKDVKKYVDSALKPTNLFKSFGVPAVTSVVTNVTAAIGTLVNFTKYLRTNIELQGIDVTPDNEVLKNNIAEALMQRNFTRIRDPRFIVQADSALFGIYEDYATSLSNIHQKRTAISDEFEARISVHSANVNKKNADLAKLKSKPKPNKKDKSRLAALPAEIASETEAKTRAQTIKAERIKWMSDFLTAAEALSLEMVASSETGMSPLSSAIQMDVLLSRPPTKGENGPKKYLLNTNIVEMGGEYLITKRLWWNQNIFYMGAAIARYELMDVQGFIQKAGSSSKMIRGKTAYRRGFQNIDIGAIGLAWEQDRDPDDFSAGPTDPGPHGQI